uniref:TIR domain-containing protein n=1 Tax=Stomoxys calcitrans TaxID=35570 RepID=A0A1I8PSR7_STOCA
MVQNLVCSISTTHPSNISISGSLTAMNAPTSSSRLEAITFQDIPLSALSKGSRKKLSYLMNSKKILRSEEGYERDWRGLAFLAKQKSLFDESNISNDDPMEIVLNLWCANSPTTATFAHLEKYLGVIDRWDVCDDIYDNLVEDTRTFHRKNQQIESSLDTGEFSGEVDVEFGYGTDPNILTTDDVIRAKKGLPLQRYDAFVLYADADLTYVTEMLTKLEDNTEYNFKLCIKDRDLLAGVAFKHVALTQLIEERCKYLIVILTNAFLSSAENKFFVDFTQALQIGTS